MSVEGTARMSVSLAALGRIRERLGMDESQRCNSGNIIQPNLPGMQRMEGMDRAGAFL
jgi:hypothetical protein